VITGSGLVASATIGLAAGVAGQTLPGMSHLGNARQQRMYANGMASSYEQAFASNNQVSQVARYALAHNDAANGVVDDVIRGTGIQLALQPLEKSFQNIIPR
jgi:hypothetical protein